MTLAQKVAIVTGAGQGIGKAVAHRLAFEGAKVIVATLHEEEGQHTVAEIQSHAGDALAIVTDVRSEVSIKAMVTATLEHYGRIDCLVNNAGITVFKPLFEASCDDWDNLMQTNLRSVFLCSKYAGAHMPEGSTIINISSNHALATNPHAEMYAASKGGINAMTRAMALSLGPHGIRVNAIMPGFTATPHYRRWLDSAADGHAIESEIHGLHPSGHIAQPEDIAGLAAFLASDASRSMTGSTLLMDNGLSANLFHSQRF